jgi:hypothetical protein
MKHGINIVTVAALMLAGLMSGTANADIIITFTEALDGGFSVTGVGSGTISATKTDDDWEFKDFATSYIVGTAAYENRDATLVSGTMKNVTTDVTVIVDAFEVDTDSNSNDDLSIKTDGDIAFSTGNLFEIAFSATYLVGNVPFSNLVVGTHGPNLLTSSDDIFGEVYVNVVPAAPTPTHGTVFIIQ